ncbi:MAG: hypothetical protein HYT80_03215, partial [Euryarchaeota archaeon]|nr:hypothetical protein [Euryarchaeota archaeon]
LLLDQFEQPHVAEGTTLDYLATRAGGLRAAILVAQDPKATPGRRRLLAWHGPQRIKEETFYGLFGHRFQRVLSNAFGLLLERTSHFFIVNPTCEPTYVIPLPQFARFGASHRVLEEVLEAPVVVPADGLYARSAHVPSLRVYVDYDGSRYGESTRKLFYDRHGRPVPVELAAREVLQRLGYEAVPPALFHRLFLAVTDRPPSNFAPDAWPGALLGGRVSPLRVAERAQERIDALADAGALPSLLRALEAIAARPPYNAYADSGGSLPLIRRFLTRRRFESFVESVGERRLIAILRGLARGYRVVSADWFAYMEGSSRVFPCEVKARGDHLRPYQKESILYCQRNGLLDYRLLEVLHQRAMPLGGGLSFSSSESPASATPEGSR